MKSTIPSIYFFKFLFRLEALEDMRLPDYKGSMFRGAFGWSFRDPVCITKLPVCDNCILQTQCSYFQVFETEMPGHNIPFLKGVKKVPHPFVIHPQMDNKSYFKKGEIINVGLTIFGGMIQYFPFFVYTFIQMGSRGLGHNRNKYKLKSISNLDSNGIESIVYNDEDHKLLLNFSKIDNAALLKKRTQRKKITIFFNTPFRLQELGKIITNPNLVTPALLIRSIERRIITISSFFCGADSSSLFTEIIDGDLNIANNELRFHNWKRYSSRQDKSMDLGGFIGKITLQGNIKRFYPLLLIGEKINIGKNTLFGLGEYTIEL